MKKLISYALILAMLFAVIPLSAFAVSEPITIKIGRFNTYMDLGEVFAWSSADESETVETLYTGTPGANTFMHFYHVWLSFDFETQMFVVQDTETGWNKYETDWQLGPGNLIIMVYATSDSYDAVASLQIGDGLYFGYESNDYESTFGYIGIVDSYLSTEKPEKYWIPSADWEDSYGNASDGSSTSSDDTSDDSSANLRYTLSEDETYYAVSGLIGNDKNITIPSVYNNLPVKEISDEAFYQKTYLSSVIIPDSIESIGERAFSYCSALTEITVPDSVKTIGMAAFSWCRNLKTVVLPRNLEVISDSLFAYSSALVDVIIPGTVIAIGDNAFLSSAKLAEIEIPDSVKHIGECAFRSCSALTDISVPDSIITVGSDAFEDCENLIYTTYDNGIYLGNKTNPCVILMGTIKKRITSCFINENTKVIYDNAFSESLFTSLSIPKSVTCIGKEAFYRCDTLTDITFPASVVSIGKDVLLECYGIETITVEEGNQAYLSTGNCLIEVETKTLIAGCKNSVIPSNGSVEKIAEKVFYRCEYLETINIPDTIVEIGEYAFGWCLMLGKVVIPDSVEKIGENAFSDCDNLFDIYCEAESKPTGWSNLWEDGYATVHWGYKAEPEIIVGDINGDDTVTAADYIVTKRAVMSTYTLTEAQIKAGDVNGDGSVTAADYIMLKRHVMGTYVIGG